MVEAISEYSVCDTLSQPQISPRMLGMQEKIKAGTASPIKGNQGLSWSHQHHWHPNLPGYLVLNVRTIPSSVTTDYFPRPLSFDMSPLLLLVRICWSFLSHFFSVTEKYLSNTTQHLHQAQSFDAAKWLRRCLRCTLRESSFVCSHLLDALWP